MSDLFYEGFTDAQIDRVVAVMMICSTHETRGGHIFQTLTKRPERMRDYFADPKTQERVASAAGSLMEDGDGWYDSIAFRPEGLSHPNMWWGTSVENQAAAEERIPLLLQTVAALRFLSIEPLIGPVDLNFSVHDRTPGAKVDWVIVGCESGPGARPCEVSWLRDVRNRCREAGVAFFLKQAFENLDMADVGYGRPIMRGAITVGEGSSRKGVNDTLIELPYLDGVQHAAFPVLP
jgi:protein gp37